MIAKDFKPFFSWVFIIITMMTLSSCARSRGPTPDQRMAAVRSKWTICLDPGHGGDDYGTHSIERPRYHEKYLALATALMTQDHLEKMGYRVILTRKDDGFVSLDDRVKIAHQKKADLFVSIHFNSAPNRGASGVEVYHYKLGKERWRGETSRRLAQQVVARVAKTAGVKTRGAKQGNFAVIRNTSIPAILVEGGFLTNAQEMDRIKDPKHLNRIAYGMALGIDEHLHSPVR